MQKLSLFIVILLIPILAFSQGDDRYQHYVNRDYNFLRVAETVPSVAEFQAMKHFDFPKCNGKLNVSLPLYNISYRNAQVPIYLSYNTAGIKVSGVASRVGQNWHLNAGGSITRTQKGSMLDFERYDNGVSSPGFVVEYYGWQKHSETIGVETYKYAEYANIYDLEPDVFYLTAPGLTSEFIINKDYEAVEIKGDDIKIKSLVLGDKFTGVPGTCGYDCDILAFQVLSTSGVYYSFGKTTKILNIVEDRGVMYPIQDWHLTAIIWPTGEKITFEYDDLGYEEITERQVSSITASHSLQDEYQIPIESSQSEHSVQLTSKTRLKKIIFATGTVEFNYTHVRQDIIGDNALSSIEIKDYNDEPVKTIDLNYEYLTTSAGTPSRLMLNQLIFKGKTNEELNEYNLDYYPGVNYFPTHESFQYDCFGYFANNGQTAEDIRLYAYIPSDVRNTVYYPFSLGTLSGYDQYIFSGANRTPVEAHAKTGMLWKIHYPTGGYMELEYESNKMELNGKIISGGGLRVTKQSLKGTDIDWDKNYLYEYPLVKLPRFATLGTHNSKLTGSTSTDRIQFVQNYTIRYQENQVNFELLDGSSIMYAKVIETQTDNGRIEHYFNLLSDANPGKFFNAPVGYQNYFDFNPTSGWPFWSGRTNSPLRGKTEEMLYFDESGKMIKGEIFEYAFRAYNIENVNTIIGRYYKQWQGVEFEDMAIISGTYSLVPGEVVLTKKRTVKIPDGVVLDDYRLKMQIDADPALKDELLIQEETFTYNNFLQLREHSYIESDNSMHKIAYWYPTDYFGQGDDIPWIYDLYNSTNSEEEVVGLYNMYVNRYMVGVPIETVVRKTIGEDLYFIGGSLNEYRWQLNTEISYNMVLNSKNYTYNVSSPVICEFQDQAEQPEKLAYISSSAGKYYLRKSINHQLLKEFEYSNYGNLINANYADDYKIAYIWSYNNSYPIVKAANASLNKIAYTSFEEFSIGSYNTFTSQFAMMGEVLNEGKTGFNCFNGQLSILGLIMPLGDYTLSYYFKNSENDDWIIKARPIQHLSTSNPIIVDNGYIDEVRLCPSDAQISTYTYKPMQGMTSATDISNRTTTYEYDVFGRLTIVKDHNGDIVNRYSYHYKGDPTGEPSIIANPPQN